jgi:hypothetical protein
LKPFCRSNGLFSWPELDLCRLISSHAILYNLPVGYYSFSSRTASHYMTMRFEIPIENSHNKSNNNIPMLHLWVESPSLVSLGGHLPCRLFVRLISHQPQVLFSQNKTATSNQPAVLFSHSKSAPATCHQPNEQDDGLILSCIGDSIGEYVQLIAKHVADGLTSTPGHALTSFRVAWL